MTAPKHIASSLKTILQNPIVGVILDRSQDITTITNTVTEWWNYDLFSRKPSPAYDEYGIFQGTNLDLACFLYALVGRGAVINLPTYRSHTQSKIREDQRLSSRENRHGQVIGVSANKDFFSFNISIIDQNVIGADKVGDYRTFSLTNKQGEWYEGWQRIEFVPTINENKFITENRLWTDSTIGSTIIFRNFIHPNRWTSFFGHHYVISKLLINRLEEEAKFLNTQIKTMKAAGIEFPDGKGPASYDYEYGETKSEKFLAFESMIYIPEVETKGDYPVLEPSQENLVAIYNRRKEVNKVISKLRFMTRASEFAHFKAPDRFPSWIKNTSWESGFKIPKKRIEWDRLKLFQTKPGELSVSILKRTYEKSARVAT